ncbi:response regulator [Streptomyces sp. NBC_00859]|uniref:response regulator n=1 Tax=Streptomyces sp. NBC_00859 TaxID=2903682 RepID=UPI0038663198|nr:response regulator [Streptomyces sp. NBC_00859]
MSESIWIQLIGTLPSVLWAAFATIVFLALRGPLVRSVIPRLTVFRALGFEFEMAGALLAQAADEAHVDVTPQDRSGALGRMEHAADVLRGGRILWVDDHPENNTTLTRLFRSVGMAVDTARSTAEALAALRRQSYDVILSDMGRADDPQAGITMLRELERRNIDLPVVIHAAHVDQERGVDRRAFAATASPVEVVHYVIDLMERARLGSP